MIELIEIVAVFILSGILVYKLAYKRGQYDLNTTLMRIARYGDGTYTVIGGNEFIAKFVLEILGTVKGDIIKKRDK